MRDYGPDGVENAAISYTSGIMNGRGRYGGKRLPLTRFQVSSGLTYRFRTVNSGGEFLYDVSVDGHMLKIMALDGTDVVPYSVDAAILAPGETLDFEIETNQLAGLYWLRARTLRATTIDSYTKREILGVIQYTGSSSTDDPKSTPRDCTSGNPCKTLNCPFKNYPASYQRQCVSIAAMRSVRNYAESHGVVDGEVDTELFLNGGYNWGSSINGRKMLMPNAPIFMKNRRIADCNKVCKDQTVGCICSSTYSIPAGKTIQLILSNLEYGEDLIAHHPMHLHGHTFAVLKIGYGTYNTSGHYVYHTADVVCDNRICRTPKWNQSVDVNLNFNNPPLKNTIVVPARGYVVVRFKSDNPGRWLFHCHTVTHSTEGMVALFIEGRKELLPSVPQDFPTCYGFDWSAEQYASYMEGTVDGLGNGNDMEKEEDKNKNRGNDVIGIQDTSPMTKYELIGVVVGCVVIGMLLATILFYIVNCSRKHIDNKVDTRL